MEPLGSQCMESASWMPLCIHLELAIAKLSTVCCPSIQQHLEPKCLSSSLIETLQGMVSLQTLQHACHPQGVCSVLLTVATTELQQRPSTILCLSNSFEIDNTVSSQWVVFQMLPDRLHFCPRGLVAECLPLSSPAFTTACQVKAKSSANSSKKLSGSLKSQCLLLCLLQPVSLCLWAFETGLLHRFCAREAALIILMRSIFFIIPLLFLLNSFPRHQKTTLNVHVVPQENPKPIFSLLSLTRRPLMSMLFVFTMLFLII